MNYAIYTFFALLTFNITTGVYLFVEKIGLSYLDIKIYYLGGDHVLAKTTYGLLETIVPHLFAQGLIIFIVAHFFNFFIDSKRLPIICFLSAFITLISPVMITLGYEVFIIIKLVSFILFYVSLFMMMYYVIKISQKGVIKFKS